jgi:hypothetical protein
MPYSGSASGYGMIGQTEDAYFKMVNDRGAINRRKIEFISYDDRYSPWEITTTIANDRPSRQGISPFTDQSRCARNSLM